MHTKISGVVVKEDHDKLPVLYKLNEKDFKIAKSLIVEEIESRLNPEDRVEYWECFNFDGVWDFDVEQALLRRRKKIKHKGHKYINHRAIKDLAIYFGLPAHMGKLFLNELKLDNNPVNDRARMLAKSLGLM